MKKHYVGHVPMKGWTPPKLVYFRADREPTQATHGRMFGAVIGPFRTQRAEKWAVNYGLNNPHFQTVDDAERLSRITA